MKKVMMEEHGKYEIDCTDAVWFCGYIHEMYHESGVSFLCDADFVLETEQDLLLVEYKNGNIEEALSHIKEENQYNPFGEKNFQKLIRKFYDSIPYLYLNDKLNKPICYIFVLEYPRGNSSSRKLLRNKMKKKLPFKLQEKTASGMSLIRSVDVMNIQEWNEDTYFGRFPIERVAK